MISDIIVPSSKDIDVGSSTSNVPQMILAREWVHLSTCMGKGLYVSFGYAPFSLCCFASSVATFLNSDSCYGLLL